MLVLQFFIAPCREAQAPAALWGKRAKKEARFLKAATFPVAEYVHYTTDITQATQLRRSFPPGGLTVGTLLLSRATVIAPPGTIQRKESFCIPIALRLLFPGHYFW